MFCPRPLKVCEEAFGVVSNRKSTMARRVPVLTAALVMSLAAAAFGQTLVVGLADWQMAEFYTNEIIPVFEAANPGIKVELVDIGWSAENYQVRYAGGAEPDVFQGGTGMFGLAAQGLFAPLNPLIDKYGWWDVVEEFPPAVVEALSIGGSLYGIPWNYSSDNFTYLANLFANVGLDPNRPPETWEELVEYGRLLTRYDSDGNIVFQGFWTDSHRNRFAPFLYQAGGSWMNSDLTMATFGSEYGVEAAEFVQSLIHEHRIIDATRTLGDLDRGHAAMTYASSSAFLEPSVFYDLDDVRVGFPPMHRQRGQRITPNTWQITARSDLKDEAFRFIMLTLEVENVVKMGQQLGTFPVRRGAGAFSPWADDPRWLVALEAIQFGVIEPLTNAHWDYIRREFVTKTLDRIYYEREPATLLAEAERLANAYLRSQQAQQ